MAEKMTVLDDDIKEFRPVSGLLSKIITVLAIGYVGLEVIALQFVVIDLWVFMTLVMIFVIILGFLTFPLAQRIRAG